MGDLRFILGFVAGWIATTEEGRKAAGQFADSTTKFVKENLLKKEDKAD